MRTRRLPVGCFDCGLLHDSYPEALECDHRLGRHDGNADAHCPGCKDTDADERIDAWLEQMRAIAAARAEDVDGPTWQRVLGAGEIPAPTRAEAEDLRPPG